jgi:hypothetical protein
VVGSPFRDGRRSLLAVLAIRLNRLGQIVDKQAELLDAAVKRIDKLSARSRTLTLVLALVALSLASFAAGAIAMRALAWAARSR